MKRLGRSIGDIVFFMMLVAATRALALTPSVQVDYGSDATATSFWLELTGNSTTAGLDRTVSAGVTYQATPQTIGNLSNSYALAGGSTLSRDDGLFLPNGDTNDAYGDSGQFGDAFTLRNTTFEIVFRLSDVTNPRQILWETGGDTGTSFTVDGSILQFRHRSDSNPASVTYDLANLGTLGDGRSLAVADFIVVHGNCDLGNNSLELFVNGQSVGADGAGGAANDGMATSTTDISDWSDGDGDGIGNHGGADLGGFGSGIDFDGGSYVSVAGEIAGFRIYSEDGAASQAGTILDGAAIEARYREIFFDRVFSALAGNWTDANTWSPNGAPAADNIAIIGGDTHTVLIDSRITDPVGKVLIAHDLGTNDGDGVLMIQSGGALTVAGDVLINSSSGNGRSGSLSLRGTGMMEIGGDLIYGAGGDEGGAVDMNGGTLSVTNIIKRAAGVDSAQLEFGGTLNIAGGIEFRGAGPSDLIKFTAGELNFTGAAGAGRIDAAAAQAFEWTGGLINGLENFDGDLVQGGGSLHAGSGTNPTTITGDYTMGDRAGLHIGMHWSGASVLLPGIDYDQVVVGGNFDAGGGYLSIGIPGGGLPPIGSKMSIVSSGSSLIGQFGNDERISVSDEFGVFSYDFSVDYGGASGNDVVLTYEGPFLSQDYDNDGFSNMAELALGTDLNDSTDGNRFPTIFSSGNELTIRFRQQVEITQYFFTYQLYESSDLVNWTPVHEEYPAASEDQSDVPAGYRNVEIAFPVVPGESKFYKIWIGMD